jgi:peroxiredoxin
MRRAGLRAAVAIVLLFAAGAAGQGGAGLIGKPAPGFVRKGVDGPPVELAAFRGKVVLLDFWATWCAPCQTEMPQFAAWQRQYGAQGLQVVGVSMDDDAEAAQRLVRKLGLNYPVAMGDEQLGELYGGVLGLPLTYLIDKDGVVRARFQGGGNLQAMEARVKALLASR